MAELRFLYRFHLQDSSSREFEVKLDSETLAIQGPVPLPAPEWTRLSHHQCSNCPLDESRAPRCPIAERVHPLVAFFADRLSYEQVDVVVEAAGRHYSRKGTLQECLGSLFGIFMVSSGCPILNRLRPMVATHLPFMSTEENTYRMVSSFLMAQYFLAQEGQPADFSLDGLVSFLESARVANAGFCKRVSSTGVKDASLNALYTLNALGEITSLDLQTGALQVWRKRFLAYWA